MFIQMKVRQKNGPVCTLPIRNSVYTVRAFVSINNGVFSIKKKIPLYVLLWAVLSYLSPFFCSAFMLQRHKRLQRSVLLFARANTYTQTHLSLLPSSVDYILHQLPGSLSCLWLRTRAPRAYKNTNTKKPSVFIKNHGMDSSDHPRFPQGWSGRLVRLLSTHTHKGGELKAI